MGGAGFLKWLAKALAIAGVLACGMLALLLPLRRDETADRHANTCLMNLRAVAYALSVYAEDNHGMLPADGWMDRLMENGLEPIEVACPVQRRFDTKTFGYALSSVVAGTSVANVFSPDQEPLVFDSAATHRNAIEHPSKMATPGRHRHRSLNAVVYVSGNARLVPAAD
jgi:hypothetical protein